MGCDLTLILTAHDETLVAGPTLTAADAACACAEADGISIERIIALDRATPATTDWFAQAAGPQWHQIEMDEGDLGRVRNAILPRTKGAFVAFLDADDLFSENWLRDGVRRLQRAQADGQRAIAHPELNWLFDGASSVFLKPDQDDPLFSPWHFYFMNYYDSLCMAPREAHLAHPYVHRDIPNGLSFQDWQFSIETMAAGWHHVNAPGTIIFKRRRDASLVSESRARRALVRAQEAMRIDRVSALGGPRKAAPDIGTKPTRGLLARLGQSLRGAEASPETEPKPPAHSGPYFAARVARATARRGAGHKSRVYKTIRAEFDIAYYLARYGDILDLEEVDPVAHYMRAGWREGRDPTPWFGTKAYLSRHPELAEGDENPFYHYLTKGRKAGDLAAPMTGFRAVAETLGYDPITAEKLWRARYEGLRARLDHGDLGAQAVHAAQIEPLIAQGWSEAYQVKIPPFHNDVTCARTGAIFALAKAAGLRPAKAVICVNRARFGAAPRVEGHVARALAARHGSDQVLVITTDKPGEMPAGKLPRGVRHVDFAALVPDLKGDARQRLLAEFLRALAPEVAFNVNSRLMWDMMTPYGTAVRASMRLYACLMCNEQTPMGYQTGYPLRRVYRHFDQLAGIFTDSQFLEQDLITRHRVPADQQARIQVLPNPVDPEIQIVPASPPDPDTQTLTRRKQVFWAGRMDPQKRVDLVYAIAAAMPDVDFHLWGDAVMGHTKALPPKPDNVTLHGAYARFDALPLHEADLWLYTSAWDGVPSMLLEVAMTGLPLVGSDVGGTTEVLRDGLATALPPQATSRDWARALQRVLDSPEEARKQALILRDQLIADRTVAAHERALFDLLDAENSA